MSFTPQLWHAITPLYHSITAHPFIAELTQGTLPQEKFQHYIQQDALYLADFARALAVMAAKAEPTAWVHRYLRFAEGAIVVEKALHGSYFQTFGISEEGVVKSPACFAYTNYLTATCWQQSFAVGVAALLPCFWIYREVGNFIWQQHQPDNPYQAWIDTYAGEEFSAIVDEAIQLTDAVAQVASPETRHQMQEAFLYSSRLEWLFWDSAYRLEQWPV
ncbi:thiaminase (transcriptional activator TenA) [Catalinimonas alkaloidigena]|uniref:Aminopyrimidine aminohydrolase n=1 Tax=Catalinimonas alkaloidigena TaxID=1075417 RepID=A0A1G8XPS2_9BACT|nr:thiaminase II [Catalinimonas alkaloidigena]SDJ92652.1 thiaminase (transcriptional activator TenA) [Catalinimonas alkaloidigena]